MDWGIGEGLKLMGRLIIVGVLLLIISAFFIGKACS